MKVHLVSETPFVRKGNGVHTAFVESVELLKEKNDIEVVVNEEGTGDVFHSHTYGPYYFWKGRNYKGRRIHTAHVIPDSIKGSLPKWQYWMPFIKWYFRKVYNYADVIIALSPTVEREIRSLGVNRQIEKIYNPIFTEHWKRDEEKRKAGRKKMGIPEDAFVVLGVGQLQPRKGIEDFIDIAAAVPEAKFVWAGGRPFGVLTEAVSRINARVTEASNQVLFTGMLDLKEMPCIYAAADLFLFPSYQENCPLAPIEAAASGIPVIFRDIKEYRTLYEHPYIKARTTEEFINLTRRFINDKKFYAEGRKISSNLITQFDRFVIRSRLIELYLRLATSEAQDKAFSHAIKV